MRLMYRNADVLDASTAVCNKRQPNNRQRELNHNLDITDSHGDLAISPAIATLAA